MFHFLVTASHDAWQDGVEEFSRSRFLEYTPDDIASIFEGINSSNIEQLKSLPCLCAYEGEENLWIAKITDIELDRHTLRIFVELDSGIGPIPFQSFIATRKRFGVHEWEFSRTHWAIKQGDLFLKLRQAELISGNVEEPPPVTVAPSPQDETLSQISVSSITDFISAVKGLSLPDKECFYRGHSDAVYRLMPSAFRADPSGIPLYRDSEHTMFREILVSNSFDFREDSSTLDRMVRMQHYSLPTRLLDITANPLIALFFAVWSETKLDAPGEVILFYLNRNKIKYFDSDTASCLANLALMSASERDQIAFELAAEPKTGYIPGANVEEDLKRFNDQIQIQRLLHYIGNEKPYFKPRILPEDLRSVICVKSKRSNDRISSQSGAFLLFGHDVVLSEDGTQEIAVKRIRVVNKRHILHELELLNITESTVFPYIENSARDIARRFRTKPLSDLGENESSTSQPSTGD
ncbi:FRG domain-containing protein [Pseudomonas sp. S2_E01]